MPHGRRHGEHAPSAVRLPVRPGTLHELCGPEPLDRAKDPPDREAHVQGPAESGEQICEVGLRRAGVHKDRLDDAVACPRGRRSRRGRHPVRRSRVPASPRRRFGCPRSGTARTPEVATDDLASGAAGLDMRDHQQLELRLDAYADLPLECDGMTRVISFALREAKVPHVAKAGELLVDGVHVVPVHYWIELGDGSVVDYRARMWGGDAEHVPHGVFRCEDFQRVEYRGEIVDVSIPQIVFDVLTRDRRCEHLEPMTAR